LNSVGLINDEEVEHLMFFKRAQINHPKKKEAVTGDSEQ